MIRHFGQKVICSGLIAIAAFGGMEILVYIFNLNQPKIYFVTAFWIFLYLIFNIVFLFDLHFKNPGSFGRAKARHQKVIFSFERAVKILSWAFYDRFRHLLKWSYSRRWLHALFLPIILFWGSVSLFFVNFSFILTQQTVLVLSSAALVSYYWFLKELFYRKKEEVDSDIFVILTVVKIYAAGLAFAAALSFLRYYCLSSWFFSGAVFAVTFLLIYQAIYLHKKVTRVNLLITLGIATILGLMGQIIYVNWGLNYFTAAVFMTAAYNLLWGTFHYYIDKSLTRRAFWEILLTSLLIGAMVLSATNFSEKIYGGCKFSINKFLKNNA